MKIYILSKLEKLLNEEETQSDDSLYSGIIILKDEIENFIKLEELNAFMHQVKSNKNTELFSLQKLNNDLIEENKKLKNKFDNLDNKYNTLVKEKNELNTKVENLTKQINELNTKVENLTKQSNVLNTKVENLTKKVEIMESIILTLLYRKAKNYSINKFYL
jgi:chromosome segregation ATPase